jgi:hypothetical protein
MIGQYAFGTPFPGKSCMPSMHTVTESWRSTVLRGEVGGEGGGSSFPAVTTKLVNSGIWRADAKSDALLRVILAR